MNRKKHLLPAGLALAALIFGAIYARTLFGLRHRHFSSPGEPRPWAASDWPRITQGTNTKTLVLHPPLAPDEISVRRSKARITIEYPGDRDSTHDAELPCDFFRADPATQTATFDGGRLDLLFIMGAFAFDAFDPAESGICDPVNLAPLSPDDFRRRQRERLGEIPWPEPPLFSSGNRDYELDLAFAHTGLEGLSATRSNVFTTATCVKLESDGGGYNRSGNALLASTLIRDHLYAGPHTFELEISHGPEVREVAATPGSIADFEKFQCRILAIDAGQIDSVSRGNVMINGKTTLQLDLVPAEDPRSADPSSILVLSVGPQVYGSQCAIDVIDRDGKAHGLRGQSMSFLSAFHVPLAPDEIERVRFTCRLFHKRFFFELPGLPGLPRQNRAPRNLFGMRIPYLRIDSPSEFIPFIADCAQVRPERSYHATYTFPDHYFPAVFRDITLQDLTAEYLSYTTYPLGQKLKIDPATHAIFYEPPFDWRMPWTLWMSKARRLLP